MAATFCKRRKVPNVFELSLLGGGSNTFAHLESIYARATEISGQPLTDGFHFGQTLVNDFGRPFERGFNSVDGFSGWGTAGRWVVYLRGEYQHSAAAPAISPQVANAIATMDGNPVFPPSPISAREQERLLDAYIGLNIANWELSYGQESEAWSPNESGSPLFSNNAFPVRMFRINRVSPFRLPSILSLLGPMRWDAFLARCKATRLLRDFFFMVKKSVSSPRGTLNLVSATRSFSEARACHSHSID